MVIDAVEDKLEMEILTSSVLSSCTWKDRHTMVIASVESHTILEESVLRVQNGTTHQIDRTIDDIHTAVVDHVDLSPDYSRAPSPELK